MSTTKSSETGGAKLSSPQSAAVSEGSTNTARQTPSTDASIRPVQPDPSAAIRISESAGPEDVTNAIRKVCTDSQGRVQALTQAIGRQPGMPGSLSDLLNNDLRGLAQQFITTTHYCHLLEKKIEERTRTTFQERTAERAAHEAHLESYRQQLKKANDTIDRLSGKVREFDHAYEKFDKSDKSDKLRKIELERRAEKLAEKINNQKRRINEQQSQIETLKRKVSDGSKLSKGSRLVDNRDDDKSPELEFPHSATSELGEKHRRSPPIPQPKLPSGISLKDEEFLINNLKNLKADFPASRDAFPVPVRPARIERDNDFRHGLPPSSYGHFGSQVPPMSTMAHFGPMSGALAPYGAYPPIGGYGPPGPTFRGNTPTNGPQGMYHGYANTSYQPPTFSRTRATHSSRNSQSGNAGALVLRRDDDSDFDPETKAWKDMFMRLFKTVGGWSDTYCRQIVPGSVEAATRSNPKLWEYMLKVAACYKDAQAAPKHALFMLNSPEHRTHFITRLVLQYIEQEMLHNKFWMGWDDETDRLLQSIGPMIESVSHPLEQRRYARQQLRATIEGIVADPDYSRFRTFKTTEHAARFKDIAGPFLSPNAVKSEASLGLHSVANLAMEISHKMMTSRLSFTFTWNECAVKFSHDSHIALNADQHGLALQHKHTRVMLVITPSISYRDHSGVSIVPRGVTKAQVLIMN
ncbi:hypothetical protein VPNG_01165 [Cytospora leucostoma]|uniref:Uncharacterized protein n=1 Tax=Cytospora leucostoma TaxID=1230097 RepID=A0A423XL96_9PEZI|nr:hypothetical protein VPNG_01165 [Cytospora leucostoma]